MLPANIYQIYYSEQTRQAADSGFLAMDNLSNPRPDWREYWPIRNFLLNNKLTENQYYGFFSPKFKDKTNLTSGDVSDFLSQCSGAPDVILFTPYFDQSAFFINIFEQGAIGYDGLFDLFRDCIAQINPAIDLSTLVMDSQNTVFCNYFIAKPLFWRAWINICEYFFLIAEDASSELGARLNASVNYNKVGAPAKVFLIERIASYLLATESKWNTKNYNPMALPLSTIAVSRFPSHLLKMDALKFASRHFKHEQYLNSFFELRSEILATLQNKSQHRTDVNILPD